MLVKAGTLGSAQGLAEAHMQSKWPQTVRCLAGHRGLCGAARWVSGWCTPACAPLPHSWGSETAACARHIWLSCCTTQTAQLGMFCACLMQTFHEAMCARMVRLVNGRLVMHCAGSVQMKNLGSCRNGELHREGGSPPGDSTTATWVDTDLLSAA